MEISPEIWIITFSKLEELFPILTFWDMKKGSFRNNFHKISESTQKCKNGKLYSSYRYGYPTTSA